MPIEHWMMFGTFAEQRHFIYPSKSTYTGVVINANMAAHAPDGLAAFLLEKTADVRYIVDPRTDAFQHALQFVSKKDGEPKSSIRKLAEKYEAPVSDLLGERPIRPQDFSDEGVLRGFVERCIEFQYKVLSSVMAENDSLKYFPPGKPLTPAAVVSPYFFISETTYGEWLPIIEKAAAIARENCPPNAKLFTSVVVSQGVVLDKDIRNELAGRLGSLNLDGYLLWVDNLDEQQAAMAELKGLYDLAGSLRIKGREVINLHGGYFSVLAAGTLGNSHFTGVTHGPEFGEFRSVVPVGGGIPIARYYIPQLHARTRYDAAIEYLRAKGWLDDATTFYANVCDCKECQDTIGGDIANFTKFGEGNPKEVKRGKGVVRIEFPTTDTKLRCLRHYLERKAREYDLAAQDSSEAIVEDLKRGWTDFKDVLGPDGVSHLKKWAQVFKTDINWS